MAIHRPAPVEDSFFAFLARWAEDSGLYLTREAHMKATPQPEDVQAALISVHTEEF